MPLFGRGEERPRTAAEREAARLERERRRAEREGRPLPEPPTPELDEGAAPVDHDEPPPFEWEPPPVRADEEPEPVPEPAAEGDAEPEPDPEPAVEPEPEPEPAAPARSAWREPAGDGPAPPPRARAWQQRPAPAAPEPEPGTAWKSERDGNGVPEAEPTVARGADDPQATQPFDPIATETAARRTVSLPRPQTDAGEWDAPIGTVRRSRAGAGYQPQPGAPGLPYRKLGVNRPRRRWLRRIGALLALAAAIGVAVFVYLLYQPMHGDGSGRVAVTVPSGATASQIGDLLEERGVVSSGFFFGLRARLSGERANLRSGRYVLKRDMPYGAALTALTTAPKAAPVLDVTLPEGPSRREAAPLVRQAGVRGDYLAATRRSGKLDPRDYGAPRGTRTLEGFMFPSTYELRQSQATAPRLVSRQIDAFKDAFAKVNLSAARRKNLSRYDVLIIASMIEREALAPRDRRLISAVIYNRLKQDMPLGIDATLRYALNQWSRPLRVSELDSNSAYNTRKRRGLPPTPIGNPGLAALRAAANPANVPYLFYVVKPCGNGAHAFSSSDAKFQQDVARYNRARDRRGGKDPSRC